MKAIQMNKRMRELRTEMEAALTAAKGYMTGETKDVEKANARMAEYNSLQAEFDTEKAIYEAEQAEAASKSVEPEQKRTDNKDAVKKFAAAARAGFPKAMNEGTAADGGYTVPEDIVYRVEELRDAKYSLRQEVTVENVETEKGRRTYKVRAQQTGFTKVGEGGRIPKKDTPQFSVIDYVIEKYGGIFAVTDELLEDSDDNIAGTLTRWIADEARVTDNKLILAEIDSTWSTKTEFKTLDDIKKALNVTLGQAFKPTSAIITNDDGLQWFDTLKDGVGRDLLQPDPTAPANLRIRVGAATVPIKVIPNSELATDNDKIPVIVGDLKEAVTLFDRRQLSIKSSDVANTTDVNAFEEDMTLFRAIERLDVVTKDDEAIVNGYIDVSV